MPRYTAVLDACVLVPIALADALLRVAEKGLCRPLWTDRILSEAQAAIEEVHPGIDAGKRFAGMREAFDDSLITGWEDLEGGLSLPDEDDRHVVAAAIKGGAQAIITANLADFPAAALGLEAVHPDDFLLDQLDLSPPTILQVIREQAAHTRRPPLTPQDLTTLLGRAGLRTSALRCQQPAPLRSEYPDPRAMVSGWRFPHSAPDSELARISWRPLMTRRPIRSRRSRNSEHLPTRGGRNGSSAETASCRPAPGSPRLCPDSRRLCRA
jgi:hypothetical protein